MNPITREESLLDGQDLTPITRKEQFIKRIYDKTQEIPEPITREEYFLKKAGEGTSPVAIEQLNVTENGTYSEQGKAYSPVIVEVPVPTLITKTITENGTYTASEDNADGYSQVTVNVEGFKKKFIANTPTDIASFNDGTANPMPSLEISIEPVQSGSGDPSPQNIRPISRWSGANVQNYKAYQIFDATTNSVTQNGVTVTYMGKGKYSIKGTKATSQDLSIEIPVKEFTIYDGADSWIRFNNTLSSNLFRLYFKDGDTDVETWVLQPINRDNGYSGMRGKTVNTLVFSDIGISAGTSYDFSVQIEIYSSGSATTSSVIFRDGATPITVYGGRLNVTTGKLTVTMASVDLGTLNWEIGYRGFIARITNPAPANNDVPANMLCTEYPIKAYTGQPQKSISRISDSVLIRFLDSDYESTDAVKTAMNGVQLVYELATPQTYQLTPTQVTTLLGQNNIFADCGQILEGEYFVTL